MLKGDPDVNEVFAKVIQNEIDSVISTLTERLKKTAKELTLSFKKYLKASYDRISKTKTLLYKDMSVHLDEIFINLNLEIDNTVIKLQNIVDSLQPTSNYIFSATAGAGKSILAKKLFISILEKGNIGIPIFYELRNLNNADKSIIESIIEVFDSYNLTLDEDLFKKLLKKNKFILILDGYDEIEYSIKKRIDKEIKTLLEKYQNTPVFITTRPNEQLQSFTHCEVFTVQPLDKKQAVELVTKLKYDEKIKEKFIKQLKRQLFNKHSDFLSNPLLLTIMLMTYGEIAEIPEKMHIFYEQAFDVLFFKHDASKGMYKRDIKTKLASDDFKRILSIISFKSYLKSQINFSNSSLIEHIRTAKKLSGLSFNNDDFKYDLLNSVCILINDGTSTTYTHRSFQEYFAAHFITNFSITKKEELLEKLLKKYSNDKVLLLAFEMNSNSIEKELIIPMGDKYLKKYYAAKNDVEKLKICFSKIRASNSPSRRKHTYFVIDDTDYWHYLRFFEEIYSKKYKTLAPRYKTTLTKKSFYHLFGKGEVDKSLLINDENASKLFESGIVEIQEKRVKFLISVLEKVKKRNNDMDINLEEFL